MYRECWNANFSGEHMRKDQGMTLVEVIVALLLFSMVVVFTLPVFNMASRLNTQAKTLQDAQHLGEVAMEQVILRASIYTKPYYQTNPEDLFVGFLLCSKGDDRFGDGLLYHKHDDQFNDFDIYIETEIPKRGEAIIVTVYHHDVLVYKSESWLVYGKTQ